MLADGIDAVATAHTGSDQAETLLFRLARGTGLHGAAGIRPSRPGYLRPLLCLTRADTEAVCRACGERWVTDETNDADDYARNRLRHGALPALCGVNSAAERNLARFCEKAARRTNTSPGRRMRCWLRPGSGRKKPARRGGIRPAQRPARVDVRAFAAD